MWNEKKVITKKKNDSIWGANMANGDNSSKFTECGVFLCVENRLEIEHVC